MRAMNDEEREAMRRVDERLMTPDRPKERVARELAKMCSEVAPESKEWDALTDDEKAFCYEYADRIIEALRSEGEGRDDTDAMLGKLLRDTFTPEAWGRIAKAIEERDLGLDLGVIQRLWTIRHLLDRTPSTETDAPGEGEIENPFGPTHRGPGEGSEDEGDFWDALDDLREAADEGTGEGEGHHAEGRRKRRVERFLRAEGVDPEPTVEGEEEMVSVDTFAAEQDIRLHREDQLVEIASHLGLPTDWSNGYDVGDAIIEHLDRPDPDEGSVERDCTCRPVDGSSEWDGHIHPDPECPLHGLRSRPEPTVEGGEMRWTDEDEAELRDYQARVSCAGRYDQYEPTRRDHSRLAELKERKRRTTKAWVRQVEEYQSLSDSALEQVARYRAEQGGVNPDTAALLVLLCERWSRLRERGEPTVEGEDPWMLPEGLETLALDLEESPYIERVDAENIGRMLREAAARLRERTEGERVYDAVRAERRRQDEKWGTSFPDRDWDRWVTILVEEVGEFAEAVLEMPYTEDGEEAVRKELVQIAAVAVSALTFGAPQGSQRGAGGDGIHEPTREEG